MKRILSLAIVFAVAAMFGTGDLSAQGFGGGHGNHGGGIGHGGGNGYGLGNGYGYWPAWNDFYNVRSFDRPASPPYFALYPPVHYSDQIVRRPMGISPYAVPPGVTPVEMTFTAAPEPQIVRNPFVSPKAKPVTSSKLDTDT